MEEQVVFIKNVDTLLNLENQLDSEPILISDELQNKFCYVEAGDEIQCGIAYYDYGVKPDYMMGENNTNLWIGFGKKLICIDIINKTVIFEDELSSIFYELISDSCKRYICAICELDVYCFYSAKFNWKMGFRDIINKYQIEKDSDIKIVCEDDEEVLIKLSNGNIVD